MNTKVFIAIVAVAVGSLYFVRADESATPATDPRIDKLIEQNEQILKTQADILQQIQEIKRDLQQLRRRSS
jgi:hypothetical protein